MRFVILFIMTARKQHGFCVIPLLIGSWTETCVYKVLALGLPRQLMLTTNL